MSRSHRVADVPQSVATAAAARALFFYFLLSLFVFSVGHVFSFFLFFPFFIISRGESLVTDKSAAAAAQQPPTMRPKRSVALARTDIDRRRRRHNVTLV